MAERSDLSVEWSRSPRVITIAAPSTEIVAQDLVDTLRVIESNLLALDDDSLLNAEGKAELGGGVVVGITATLQNAQVAFESRAVSDSNGTATSVNSGLKLIDTAATFIADGIIPGDTIVNYRDRSIATVRIVVSDTELIHYQLIDGISNDWKIADVYKVYKTAQCEISGGNVVAIDSVGSEISPVSTTVFTQIVRTSSSSATLQELDALQFASYGGHVSVDITSGNTGVDYPVGNMEYPVNNIPDAVLIGQSTGLNKLFIIGNITLIDDVKDFIIVGENVVKTKVIVETVANVLGCEFKEMLLTGILDGNSTVTHCLIENLNYFEGTIASCGILPGVLTLGSTGLTRLINCWSEGCTVNLPEINMGSTGRSLIARGLKGPFKLTNKTGAGDFVCMDFDSGDLLIDSTVTAGVIRIAGNMTYTNNGTATLNKDGVMNVERIIDGIWEYVPIGTPISGSAMDMLSMVWQQTGGRRHIVANQEIFYKADNVSEVMRFDLFDSAGQPTMTNVFERVRV